jgi:hypothetical protein
MKKLIQYSALAGIMIILLAVIISFWRSNENAAITESSESTSPSRMLQMGPVAGGMLSTRKVGEVVVKMEASRTWFKKSKTLGFDNALFKKMVASDFRLTISKGGKELLAISKDQIEMSPDQNIIDINKPQIIFPSDMKQPDSIRLDNQKMLLQIKTEKDKIIWDLAKM